VRARCKTCAWEPTDDEITMITGDHSERVAAISTCTTAVRFRAVRHAIDGSVACVLPNPRLSPVQGRISEGWEGEWAIASPLSSRIRVQGIDYVRDTRFNDKSNYAWLLNVELGFSSSPYSVKNQVKRKHKFQNTDRC
jgi:hypothetical protein